MMFKAALKKDTARFTALEGMECLECGACAYVCPAKRPLTQGFKEMKRRVGAERRAAAAKAKAEAEAKAKADAEAKAKTEEIQKQIEAMKKETARLQEEAAKAKEQIKTVEEPTKAVTPTPAKTVTPAPVKANEPEKKVEIIEANPVSQETKVAPSNKKQNSAKVEEEKGVKTRLAPINDDDDNEEDKSIYLAKNAVPVVNGKVVWSAVIKVPGKSADEIYNITDEYLKALTSDKLQLEGSKVAIDNKAKHNLTATVHEWLIFKNSALALDRAEFFYVLNAVCKNGQVEISMSRLKYKYDMQGNVENYTAEKWITDKEAVNKKRTRLYPISGKFRKKSIDRKNEIFETLAQALQ